MREELTAALMLTLCGIHDLRTGRVRRSFLIVWAVISVLIVLRDKTGASAAAVRAVPGLLWLACAGISRGTAGSGDGWCLLFCGLTAGTEAVLEILAAAMAGAAAVGAALRASGAEKSGRLPFVPFLAGGAWLLLLGELMARGG